MNSRDPQELQDEINKIKTSPKHEFDARGAVYFIQNETQSLKFPTGTYYLTLKNFTVKVKGYFPVFAAAQTKDLFRFCTFQNIEIEYLPLDQPLPQKELIVWDFSSFSYSFFHKIRILAPNATCFYGKGGNSSSPYGNRFELVNLGGLRGFHFDSDANDDVSGPNCNTIADSRIQPQGGNSVGVLISRWPQLTRIQNTTFESPHKIAIGVQSDGESTLIDGCRFESMNIGIAITSNAVNNTIGFNYYSSNTVKWQVDPNAKNTFIHNPSSFGKLVSAL